MYNQDFVRSVYEHRGAPSYAAEVELLDSRNLRPGRRIILEVVVKYDITIQEMVSIRKQINLIQPRFEACWRLKRETAYSFPQIGKMLGGRNHATIISACRQYEQFQRVKQGLEPVTKFYEKHLDLEKVILPDAQISLTSEEWIG